MVAGLGGFKVVVGVFATLVGQEGFSKSKKHEAKHSAVRACCKGEARHGTVKDHRGGRGDGRASEREGCCTFED